MLNLIYMKKILLLLIISSFVFSCAPKVVEKKVEKKPEVSATKVVEKFLEALKQQQYDKAFDCIYIVNSDREGYVSRLKSLSAQNGYRLVDYQILATQLFKESAIVVAELKTSHIDKDTNQTVTKTTRNRYDLAVIDGKWKVTKDSCIKDCQ